MNFSRSFPHRSSSSLLGVVLAAAALAAGGCEKSSPAAMQPPVVPVVSVTEKDVPIYGDWVATLDGYTNAQIEPQVSGYLIKQTYQEGSFVRKGQVLFEIDPRPFQAVLDQAKGQLAEANAQLGLATINVNRDTPVAKLHAIPQSQLDNDIQAKLSAEAAVQAAQATVGIAGIAQTQIGNLVSPTTVLTTVSKVDPIKVYFPISEQEYLQISGNLSGSGTVDLLSKRNAVPLTLTLSNGDEYPHKGTIVFADRQIDPQTGTIRIVGAFPNPGNILRPGQFGRIRAVTDERKHALLIPQRAVSELQGSYQVAVVGSDDKVSIRPIKVAEKVGSMWVVTDGLKAGESVVTQGIQEVGDGATVRPTPDTTVDTSVDATKSAAN
jgi:membrane fusion protein (multidrug efflux system)